LGGDSLVETGRRHDKVAFVGCGCPLHDQPVSARRVNVVFKQRAGVGVALVGE